MKNKKIFFISLLFIIGIFIGRAETSKDGKIHILFVGNSFTNGHIDRVKPASEIYPAEAVDLAQDDHKSASTGGVPGIFDRLAREAGINNLKIYTRVINGKRLDEALKDSDISKHAYDYAVLQEHSTNPLTNCNCNSNPDLFRKSVKEFASLLRQNNPGINIYLSETWGRPNMVDKNYPTLKDMTIDLRASYEQAALESNTEKSPVQVSYVGDTFLKAIQQGIAFESGWDGKGENPIPAGMIDLFFTDRYHASNYGYYLIALVHFVTILDEDPRSLPTGEGSVVAELGLDENAAKALQQIAYESKKSPSKRKRVLTIGDSTMADYAAESYMRGWGQMLRLLAQDSVIIDNAARNGRSSKSFYYERWKDLVKTLNKGDYVFIQFGHNDEKSGGDESDPDDKTLRGTAPWGLYLYYLERYVTEARERGAIPVLFTSVVRRVMEDGKIKEIGLHNLTKADYPLRNLNYPLAMKYVAKKLNVQLIDMTKLTGDMVVGLGADKSKRLLYNAKDDTHLQPAGAVLFARLAVQGLFDQELMKDYFTLPSGFTVKLKKSDFGAVNVDSSAINIVTLTGLDLKSEKGTLKVTAPNSFEISLSKDSGFEKELPIPYIDHNFCIDIFVRFSPKKPKAYAGNLQFSLDGVKQSPVFLQGKGKTITK